MEYIEVKITKEMKDFAERKFKRIKIDTSKKLNRFGSEGKRIFEGYLGEAMVCSHFHMEDVDDYEYDSMLNNNKIEIKTISGKFKPPPYYLATVNSCLEGEQRKQNSDYYVFTRILNDYSLGWIVGFIECDEFFRIGNFVKKGETYEGMLFEKADATCARINRLNEISGLNYIINGSECEICGNNNPKNIKFISACDKCESVYSIENSFEVYS